MRLICSHTFQLKKPAYTKLKEKVLRKMRTGKTMITKEVTIEIVQNNFLAVKKKNLLGARNDTQ
jgi:hypothetical protein